MEIELCVTRRVSVYAHVLLCFTTIFLWVYWAGWALLAGWLFLV